MCPLRRVRVAVAAQALSGNTMVSEFGEKAPLANAFEIWRPTLLANQSAGDRQPMKALGGRLKWCHDARAQRAPPNERRASKKSAFLKICQERWALKVFSFGLIEPLHNEGLKVVI